MELCLILTTNELYTLYDIFRETRWRVSASVEYSVDEWMSDIRDLFSDKDEVKKVRTYKLLFKGQYYDMFKHCIEEAISIRMFYEGNILSNEIHQILGGKEWK